MTSIPATRGLENYNNTCYVNVVLQLLARSPPIIKWAQEYVHSSSDPSSECIKCLIRDTILKMRRGPWTIPLLPFDLLRWINGRNPAFREGEQADPHELLCYLMDQAGLDFFHHEEIEKVACDVKGQVVERTFTLTQPGLGTHHTINSASTVRLSAVKLLEDYMSTRNSRICDSSVGKRCVDRSFAKTPEILLMKLNRLTFSNNIWSKNTSPCYIDPELIIATQHGDDVKYQICGVIEHCGTTPLEGHVTAKVVDNGRWYTYSDDEIQEGDVTNGESYLIFYSNASAVEVIEPSTTNHQDIIFDENEIFNMDENYLSKRADVQEWTRNYSTKIHNEWLKKCRLLVICLPKSGGNQPFIDQYNSFLEGHQPLFYTITWENSPFLKRLRKDRTIKRDYDVFSKRIGFKMGTHNVSFNFALQSLYNILHTHIQRRTPKFEFIFDASKRCLVTQAVIRHWEETKLAVINSLDSVIDEKPIFCPGFCSRNCFEKNEIFHRGLDGMKLMTPPDDTEDSRLETWRFAGKSSAWNTHPLRHLLSDPNFNHDDGLKPQIINLLSDCEIRMNETYNTYMFMVVNGAPGHSSDDLYMHWKNKSAKFGVYVGMTKHGPFRQIHLLTNRNGDTSSVSKFLDDTSTVYLLTTHQYSNYTDASLAEAQLIAVFHRIRDQHRKTDLPLNFDILNKNLPSIPLYDANNESKAILEKFLLRGVLPFYFKNEPVEVEYDEDTILKRFLVEHVIREPDKPNLQRNAFKAFLQRRQLTRKANKTVYPCVDCVKSFKTKEGLSRHKRLHQGKSLVCDICQITFKYKSCLSKHRKKHTASIKFKCNKCPRTFASGNMLERHEKIHQGKTSKCTVCLREYVSAHNLRLHATTHGARVIYKCAICKRVFKTDGGLRLHTKLHKSDTLFKCSNCGKEGYSSYKFTIRSGIQSSTHPSWCRDCYGSIRKQAHLISHQTSPPVAKFFNCSTCQRTFTCQQMLERHEKIHQGKTFKCMVCLREYATARTLQEHTKTHGDRQTYMCTICKRSYKTSSGLKAHIKSHKCNAHNLNTQTKSHKRIPNRHQCRLCERSYGKRSHLIRHEKAHEAHEMFQCDKCPRTFTCQQMLERHEKIHQGKTSKCTVCLREYATARTLQEHAKTHGDRQTYTCTICKRSYKTASGLSEHKKSHKPIPNRHVRHKKPPEFKPQLKCSTCPRTFRNRKMLNFHQKIHLGKTFKCTICLGEYPGPDSLRKHEKVHNADTPFKCKDCGMDYHTAFQLRNHSNVHAENGYRCSVCNKSFKTQQELMRHEETHLAKPLFKCNICPRTFRSQKMLDTHHNNHEGKTFKCDICLGDFSTHCNLKIHIQTHNDEYLYKCKSCKSAYKTSQGLNQHLKIHKRDKRAKNPTKSDSVKKLSK